MSYTKGLQIFEGIAAAYVSTEDGHHVAKFSADGLPVADDFANALMFVAAGPMLEALEAIIDSADDGRGVPEWLTERLLPARAAIALAKGEKP